MIYQLTIYYGALAGDKVIYSSETHLDNCTNLITEEQVNEELFKFPIRQQILKDGFVPDDFKFDYITKEQYENRICKGNEISTTLEMKNGK